MINAPCRWLLIPLRNGLFAVLVVMTVPDGGAAEGQVVVAEAAQGPQVVYVPTQAPSRLSAEQSQLILRAAEQKKPEGRDLWFIAVVHNDAKYTCWSLAYYMPDERSPRVRKGRYTDIHLGMESEVTAQAKVVFGTKWELKSNREGEYVQVSPAGRPFGGGKPEVPPPAYIPFPRPVYPKALLGERKVELMTNEQLVSLVDFARVELGRSDTALPFDAKEAGLGENELRELVEKELDRSEKARTEGGANGAGEGEGIDREQLKEMVLKQMGLKQRDDSICSVVVAGEDRFAVAAGVSDWGGRYIHVERGAGGRFKVTQSGMWHDADWIWWPEPVKKAAE